MKKTLFYADKDGSLKVLGMDVNGDIKNLHLVVNGSDLTESLVLERIEVFIEKEIIEVKSKTKGKGKTKGKVAE